MKFFRLLPIFIVFFFFLFFLKTHSYVNRSEDLSIRKVYGNLSVREYGFKQKESVKSWLRGIVSSAYALDLDCPTGMVEVPGVGGHESFCVDKYEAKQSGSMAVSQASGTPWVSITQYDAREACIAAGKHLITEKEWLQIAQNVEMVGWNWSGGYPGVGYMSDGHSDNDGSGALAASTDDAPCSGTGQTCDTSTWNNQRRTYKLSNGEYIWDMGGNVWEWTDAFTYDDYPVANNWSGWTACSTPDGICGNTLATNDQRYGGNTIALRAFQRGGNWTYGTTSGVFALALSNVPSYTDARVGFRCAR